MKKLFLSFSIILLSMTVGCQKVDLTDDPAPNSNGGRPSITQTEIVNRDAKAVKLGRQLQNPFSVENMARALDMLRDSLAQPNNIGLTRAATDGVEIYPTNLYVRMCAVDSATNEQLIADTTLSLYDYPRDYKVEEAGDYYFDTVGVVDTRYQWWYATVPVDYCPHNGVKYEVIEELFIPENSIYYTKEDVTETRSAGGKVMDYSFVNALTVAAFYLTDNADQMQQSPEQLQSVATRATYDRCYGCRFLWWTWTECRTYSIPEGRIMVNTKNGNVPVKGVKVRVARWFAEDSFYTDQDGYYRGNREWEHTGAWLEYKVIFQGNNGIGRWTQTHFIGTAAYSGGVQPLDGYSLTFYDNSHYWGRAVLHNAINDYMTKCSQGDGLTQLTNHMTIQVVEKFADKNGDVIIGGAAFMGFPSTMWLEFYRKAWVHDQITYLAWHELSHAAHYQTMWNNKGYTYAVNFWNTLYFKEMGGYGKKGDLNWQNVALAEGWSAYCEWYFARKYLTTYPTLADAKYATYPFNYMNMFRRLAEEAKCSMAKIQQSLACNTIAEFKTAMTSGVMSPTSIAKIRSIISEYE